MHLLIDVSTIANIKNANNQDIIFHGIYYAKAAYTEAIIIDMSGQRLNISRVRQLVDGRNNSFLCLF